MNTWSPAAMHPDMHQSSRRVVDQDAPGGERTFAVLTHLSPLLGYAILGGIPGLSIVAPLIMWQVRKKDSPFLNDHGREAVNFQISLLIISFASLFILFVPAMIFGLIMSIIAAVSASKGEFYRYPCCIRVIGG